MHQDPFLLPPFHFVTPRGLFCPNYVEGRLTREGSGEHAAPQYGGRMDAGRRTQLGGEMEAAARRGPIWEEWKSRDEERDS